MWASFPLAAGLWAKAVSPQTVRSLALCECPGAGPGAAEADFSRAFGNRPRAFNRPESRQQRFDARPPQRR